MPDRSPPNAVNPAAEIRAGLVAWEPQPWGTGLCYRCRRASNMVDETGRAAHRDCKPRTVPVVVAREPTPAERWPPPAAPEPEPPPAPPSDGRMPAWAWALYERE